MDFGKIGEIALEIAKAAENCAKAVLSLRKESLSYRELIEDITKSKPDDPRVKKCAAMKAVKDGNIEVTVIFLDKDDQPVFKSEDGEKSFGFSYTVKNIDPELADLFAKHDMVVFN